MTKVRDLCKATPLFFSARLFSKSMPQTICVDMNSLRLRQEFFILDCPNLRRRFIRIVPSRVELGFPGCLRQKLNLDAQNGVRYIFSNVQNQIKDIRKMLLKVLISMSSNIHRVCKQSLKLISYVANSLGLRCLKFSFFYTTHLCFRRSLCHRYSYCNAHSNNACNQLCPGRLNFLPDAPTKEPFKSNQYSDYHNSADCYFANKFSKVKFHANPFLIERIVA